MPRLYSIAILVLGLNYLSPSDADLSKDTIPFGMISTYEGRLAFTEGCLVLNFQVPLKNYIVQNSDELYQAGVRLHSTTTPHFHDMTESHRIRLRRRIQTTNHYLTRLLRTPFLDANSSLSINEYLNSNFDITSGTPVPLNCSIHTCNSHDAYDPKTKKMVRVWSVTNRRRRSWFDGIGAALKTIIGTATEKDTQMINDQLQKYHRNFIKSQYNLKMTMETFHTMITASYEHLTTLHDEVTKLEHSVDKKALFDNLYRSWAELGDVYMHLYTLAIEVDLQSTLMRKGILPGILSIDQVHDLIGEGNSRFSPMTFPIQNITQHNLPQTLGLMQVKPTNDPYQFIILIPFIYEQNHTLYRLYPFPVKTNNSIIMPTVDNFVSIESDHNGEPIAYRIMNNVDKCLHYTGKYLCDPHFPRYDIEVPNCGISILLHRQIKEKCHYHQIEGKWIVYFPSP